VNAPTNDDDDDDDIVLPRQEQATLDRFRENLSLCKSDDEKFEVCIRYQDNMLAENTKLQFLAARIERVMSTECTEFWKKRRFGCVMESTFSHHISNTLARWRSTFKQRTFTQASVANILGKHAEGYYGAFSAMLLLPFLFSSS
jgi:hypothetical protein